MTLASSYTLQDAIEEALRKTNNGSTREVIHYLQMNHRKVLDDNSLTIESIGLGSMIRAFRKKPPNKDTYTKIKNLCFDFGLEYMDLEDEISVPLDLENILNSECDWPELDDATVDDLDKHLMLRDAQEAAHQARTECYRRLRQAAARVVPGRTDIPLRELRRIARNETDR
jgi:hypothetical protein